MPGSNLQSHTGVLLTAGAASSKASESTAATAPVNADGLSRPAVGSSTALEAGTPLNQGQASGSHVLTKGKAQGEGESEPVKHAVNFGTGDPVDIADLQHLSTGACTPGTNKPDVQAQAPKALQRDINPLKSITPPTHLPT